MFTGIVEETGQVVSLSSGDGLVRIGVQAAQVVEGVRIGDSIAVNGVCLTVNELDGKLLAFYAMPETLRRTSLSRLREGSRVNLERAVTIERRFGGHLVQGHVDGTGEVLGITAEGGAKIFEFKAPASVMQYTIEKGSICVDGVSLTVMSAGKDSFTVSVLPQTLEATNLKHSEVGDQVNLEADVIAKYVGKYVERLMGADNPWRSVEDAV